MTRWARLFLIYIPILPKLKSKEYCVFKKLSMSALIYYPFYLILFWYKDVLGGTLQFFLELNRYTASLLSLPLMLKTFFKPLKNEYRDGLVVFSVLAGIAIKSFLILISVSIVCVLLLSELIVLFLLLLLPSQLHCLRTA